MSCKQSKMIGRKIRGGTLRNGTALGGGAVARFNANPNRLTLVVGINQTITAGANVNYGVVVQSGDGQTLAVVSLYNSYVQLRVDDYGVAITGEVIITASIDGVAGLWVSEFVLDVDLEKQ